MSKLRCAVIGVGYLGRFHAQKYQALEHVELVGICDIDTSAANNIARELHTKAYTAYEDLFGQVDAVSIATSTPSHFAIAKGCIQAGIHVLIEKPICETVAQTQTLIELAKQHHVKLQVGHLERFNVAHLALEKHLTQPLFIEAQRLAPFNPRGATVNVILDVMIHDIDLIQSIVKSPLVDIDAHGAPILSSNIDIANARLTFANHCTANITASRVSFKTVRKIRIFQANTYLSVDYHAKQLAILKRGKEELFPGISSIDRHQETFENGDALLTEIQAFVEAIIMNKTPKVSGEDGLAALLTAEKITHLIHHHLAAREAETIA